MSRLCARRSKPGGLPPFCDGVDGKAAGVVIASVASARCTLRPPPVSARLREREGGEGRQDREEGEGLEDSLEGPGEVDRDARRERADERADVREGNDDSRPAAYFVRGEEVDREKQNEGEDRHLGEAEADGHRRNRHEGQPPDQEQEGGDQDMRPPKEWTAGPQSIGQDRGEENGGGGRRAQERGRDPRRPRGGGPAGPGRAVGS